MKSLILLCSVVFLAMAFVWGDADSPERGVQYGILDAENWDQLAPSGKEVDCIYGDFVLQNEFLTAVIAQPIQSRHANMTVRSVGGSLIDLTTRQQASDQLGAFYPNRRQTLLTEWKVTDLDGNELNPSDAKATREGVRLSVSGSSAKNASVTVDYELRPGQRFLLVTTRYRNATSEPMTVDRMDDLRADGGKEDMQKTPNGDSTLFWFHDRFWGQAMGIQPVGATVQSNSDSRTTVLKYLVDGSSSIQLDPGESTSLVRRIIPAAHLVDVQAIAAINDGKQVERVGLAVRDGLNRRVPNAQIELRQGDDWIGSVSTGDEGHAEFEVPIGEYQIEVSHLGVRIDSGAVPLVIQKGQKSLVMRFEQYRPGRVNARIVDEGGLGIPCKVEFRPRGETPRPVFGPETADEGVKNLIYAAHGSFQQDVPAGKYDVIVSHGPEFDAVFTSLSVPEGETVNLHAELVRSVRTPGWVSSDFHSHSSPSGDNTGSQRGRVLNLVAEHVEFAPCTEHNRVSTYDGHIAELKIAQFIATVSGMELTGSPLPLNHQNAFPIVHRPRTQDGGGPQTDSDPEKQIERLALWDDRSTKLIQQNHPDIGWLFYDRNGDGQRDDGYERSFPFINVMEIHPIHNALRLSPSESLPGRSGNNRIFNWLQLLNQGFRVYGVVNTDAHYNFHGSSSLRNWIQSSTDDPARIDSDEMMHAAREGRLIMSNGPYLEVSGEMSDGQEIVPGREYRVASGEVNLRVRVQCANWLDVDRVILLVNGRPDPQHVYTREVNPELFQNGVVKFDRLLRLKLRQDAHLVVITGHAGQKLGDVVGPTWGTAEPAALSNPVFIDVDGGGFDANGDTLDADLPVKFGARGK